MGVMSRVFVFWWLVFINSSDVFYLPGLKFNVAHLSYFLCVWYVSRVMFLRVSGIASGGEGKSTW